MATIVKPLINRPLTERSAWKGLELHYKKGLRPASARSVRGRRRARRRLTAEAAGIYLDYSKNRVTDETIRSFMQLAEESGLRQRIDAMFSGEKINLTEIEPFCIRCWAARISISSTERTSCRVHEVAGPNGRFLGACPPR